MVGRKEEVEAVKKAVEEQMGIWLQVILKRRGMIEFGEGKETSCVLGPSP